MKIPKVDDVRDVRDRSIETLHKFMRDNDIPYYLKIVNKKYIQFAFSDVLGKKDLPPEMTDISMNKKAFLNNIAILVRYINYFIEYFDEDKELMGAYLVTMYCIMKKPEDGDDEFGVDQLIFTLRNYFASRSMVDKIANMVEANVDESLIKKSDRKFDESLQLTADHLKCIMGISIIHKMIIPILSHYMKVRKGSMEISDKQLYFKCLTSFLDVFDDRFNVSFYEKIYHTATTRVSKTKNVQKLMWARKKHLGITPISFINVLMYDLFVEISQKAIFKQSVIIFIHVCFDDSTKNKLRQQDKFELRDMKMEVSDPVNEEVSKFDKLLISKAHVSEKSSLRAKMIIKDTLDRLAEEHGIEFDDAMLSYYRKNLLIDEAQVRMVYLYFAPYFQSYDMMNYVKIDNLIKMIIIMKKMLMADRYIYMPQIISGILNKDKAKRYNKKKIESYLMKHPCFDEIREQFEDSKEYLNKDALINDIKTLISCPVTIVDYDRRDLEDKKIQVNDIATMDEIANILNDI